MGFCFSSLLYSGSSLVIELSTTLELAALKDLRERLQRAQEQIKVLRNRAAASHFLDEQTRLVGKNEGLSLALSYLEEYFR